MAYSDRQYEYEEEPRRYYDEYEYEEGRRGRFRSPGEYGYYEGRHMPRPRGGGSREREYYYEDGRRRRSPSAGRRRRSTSRGRRSPSRGRYEGELSPRSIRARERPRDAQGRFLPEGVGYEEGGYGGRYREGGYEYEEGARSPRSRAKLGGFQDGRKDRGTGGYGGNERTVYVAATPGVGYGSQTLRSTYASPGVQGTQVGYGGQLEGTQAGYGGQTLRSTYVNRTPPSDLATQVIPGGSQVAIPIRPITSVGSPQNIQGGQGVYQGTYQGTQGGYQGSYQGSPNEGYQEGYQSGLRSPGGSRRHRQPGYEEIIRSDTTLNEGQAKFCGCVASAAANQPQECLEEEAWGERREGRKCANPYAVCGASVGTTSRECVDEYVRGALSPEQEQGLLSLHHKQNWEELIRK